MTELNLLQLQNAETDHQEESKDDDVMLWKCSECEVFMDLDSKCTKCDLCKRDDLIVKVRRAELCVNEFGHLVAV